MNILTLNAGSSSIKYKVFNATLTCLISGLIEGIGEKKGAWHHTREEKTSETRCFHSHEEAFSHLACRLKHDLGSHAINGVGHRVVHGGETFYKPVIITEDTLDTLKTLSPLAPLHNPVNLEGITCAQQFFPDAVQIAIFDTGFHHTLPACAYEYAIDPAVTHPNGIRRYGFHGINHEYVAHEAARFLNKPLHTCQFISLHLGNGASACLIKNGKSLDTTMGMTPMPGLIMGSRCGDIDPAIVLFLIKKGMSPQAVDTLLNKQSGLQGLAGDNDMRHLLARREQGDMAAELAIAMYVYSIQKALGAYYSQTPQLDALIFTGGVGENAAIIRQEIITPLAHLNFHLDPLRNQSKNASNVLNLAGTGIPLLVIAGNEEKLMVEKVMDLLYCARP